MALTDAAPILVFDVNETRLDIATLEPLFQRLFGSGAVMREWFAQLVLYSQTMTLASAPAVCCAERRNRGLDKQG